MPLLSLESVASTRMLPCCNVVEWIAEKLGGYIFTMRVGGVLDSYGMRKYVEVWHFTMRFVAFGIGLVTLSVLRGV